jgi:hypothetical protein
MVGFASGGRRARQASVVLLVAVAAAAHAADRPKTALLIRHLTPSERGQVGTAMLNVLRAVESALGRAALQCSPNPKPGDGFDTTNNELREVFGAAVTPTGTVPRLSATLSCAPPGDGGEEHRFDVSLRISAFAEDRTNVLDRLSGAVVATNQRVLISEQPNYPFGLSAYVGTFTGRSVDAGVPEMERPALLLSLGEAAGPFAAPIAAELNREEVVEALQAVTPLAAPSALGPEVPASFTVEERTEIERQVLSAVFASASASTSTIVEEPIRGPDLADWASYRPLAPELRESLFRNFEARRDSTVLPPLPPGARFVPKKTLKRVLNGPGDWEKFRKAYPGFGTVTTISPITLSADGTQAIVYLGWRGGPLFGQGATYVLLFSDGAWRVVYEIGRWLS